MHGDQQQGPDRCLCSGARERWRKLRGAGVPHTQRAEPPSLGLRRAPPVTTMAELSIGRHRWAARVHLQQRRFWPCLCMRQSLLVQGPQQAADAGFGLSR